MRIKTTLLLILMSVTGLGSASGQGKVAPAFSLPSASGSSVAAKDYLGKKNLVLVFYRGYW